MTDSQTMAHAAVLESVRANLPERFVVDDVGPACLAVLCGSTLWQVWLFADMWRITRPNSVDDVGCDMWEDEAASGAAIAASVLASEAADASKPDRVALRKRLREAVRRRLSEGGG